MKKLCALFPFLIMGTIHGGWFFSFGGCANAPQRSHAMAAAYIETIVEKDPSLRKKQWIQKAEDELVKKHPRFGDGHICGLEPRHIYDYHRRTAREELKNIPADVLVECAERDLQSNLTTETFVDRAESFVAMVRFDYAVQQDHKKRSQSQLVPPCPSQDTK